MVLHFEVMNYPLAHGLQEGSGVARETLELNQLWICPFAVQLSIRTVVLFIRANLASCFLNQVSDIIIICQPCFFLAQCSTGSVFMCLHRAFPTTDSFSFSEPSILPPTRTVTRPLVSFSHLHISSLKQKSLGREQFKEEASLIHIVNIFWFTLLQDVLQLLCLPVSAHGNVYSR